MISAFLSLQLPLPPPLVLDVSLDPLEVQKHVAGYVHTSVKCVHTVEIFPVYHTDQFILAFQLHVCHHSILTCKSMFGLVYTQDPAVDSLQTSIKDSTGSKYLIG